MMKDKLSRSLPGSQVCNYEVCMFSSFHWTCQANITEQGWLLWTTQVVHCRADVPWPQIHICRTPMWRQGEKKEETQGSDGADRGEQEFMGRVMTLPLVSLKMIIRGSEAYNYRPRWGGGGGGRVKEIDGTCTEDPSSFGLLLKSLSIPWH